MLKQRVVWMIALVTQVGCAAQVIDEPEEDQKWCLWCSNDDDTSDSPSDESTSADTSTIAGLIAECWSESTACYDRVYEEQPSEHRDCGNISGVIRWIRTNPNRFAGHRGAAGYVRRAWNVACE